MRYDGREKDLNTEAHSQNRVSHRSDKSDASASAIPTILPYLGLENPSHHSSLQPDQLLADLGHTEWRTRVAALRKLADLREQTPVMSLVTALTDEHKAVRAAAARALGKLGESAPIAPLLTALDDSSWHVRAEAVLALGQHKQQAPVEPLLLALSDEDEAVRAAAAHALSQLGERAPIASLVTALHDEEWSVREAAAQALGRLGERVPIAPLLAARSDEDSTVREAAEQALQQTHPELFVTKHSGPNTQPLQIAEVPDTLQDSNQLYLLDSAMMSAPIQTTPRTNGDTHADNIQKAHVSINRNVQFAKNWWSDRPQRRPKKRSISDASVLSVPPTQRPNTTRRISLTHLLERSLIAAVIIGIAFSWLLLQQQFTATTGSSWNVSTIFKQRAPTGSAYTKVVWLTHTSESIPLVAVMSTAGRLQIWDTTQQRVQWASPTAFGHMLAMMWVPESNSLLIASTKSGDNHIQLSEIIVGKSTGNIQEYALAPLPGFPSGDPVASWSSNGKRIAVAWNNKGDRFAQVQIWDITNRRSTLIALKCSTQHPTQALSGTVNALTWSPDGKEITAACTSNDQEHTIENWSTLTGQPATKLGPGLAQYQPIPVANTVSTMAWSPDSKYLAYILNDGEIHLQPKNSPSNDAWLNYGNANHRQSFNAALTWSPNSTYLVATTAAMAPTGAIAGWDTTGNALYTYKGHSKPINDLAYSIDGKYIASAGQDGTLQIWEASTIKN